MFVQLFLVNIKLHKFSNIKIYVQLKSAFYQYTETMNTNKVQWKKTTLDCVTDLNLHLLSWETFLWAFLSYFSFQS